MDGEVKTQATGAMPGRSLSAWARFARRAARARQRMLSASRLIVMLAVLAMGATLLAGAIGYGLARQSDERLWAEQRASLRNAIGEFRTLFGKSDAIDPRFVRMVEQSVGLKDLKFETDPAASEREMQPVMDAQGRIAGFLTWDKTHPMMQAMERLMPLHRRHRRRAGRLCRIFAVAACAARGANWRRARSRRAAPPTRTSSPACPTTPRRSNCSTARWPNAPATR